jgi:hypothetical protein
VALIILRAVDLAAAALNGLFDHPAGYSVTIAIHESATPYFANTEFSATC